MKLNKLFMKSLNSLIIKLKLDEEYIWYSKEKLGQSKKKKN